MYIFFKLRKTPSGSEEIVEGLDFSSFEYIMLESIKWVTLMNLGCMSQATFWCVVRWWWFGMCMKVGRSRRSCSLPGIRIYLFIYSFIYSFMYLFIYLFCKVMFGKVVVVCVHEGRPEQKKLLPPWHPHLSPTRWVTRYFPRQIPLR